jgi:hypothetical protein
LYFKIALQDGVRWKGCRKRLPKSPFSASLSQVHRYIRVIPSLIQASKRSKRMSHEGEFWNISSPLNHLEQHSVPLGTSHHCCCRMSSLTQFLHPLAISSLPEALPPICDSKFSTDHSLPSARAHVLHTQVLCYVPLQPESLNP